MATTIETLSIKEQWVLESQVVREQKEVEKHWCAVSRYGRETVRELELREKLKYYYDCETSLQLLNTRRRRGVVCVCKGEQRVCTCE